MVHDLYHQIWGQGLWGLAEKFSAPHSYWVDIYLYAKLTHTGLLELGLEKARMNIVVGVMIYHYIIIRQRRSNTKQIYSHWLRLLSLVAKNKHINQRGKAKNNPHKQSLKNPYEA